MNFMAKGSSKRSSRFLTVHLMGGLGNQIFIFLAAKNYCDIVGKELKINIDSYVLDPHSHRVRPLLHLIFENVEYTKTPILEFLKLFSVNFARFFYKFKIKISRNKYVQKYPYSVFKSIPLNNIKFLIGYFQHKDFHVRQLKSLNFTEFFTRSRKSFGVPENYVAIHYRDYQSFGNLIDEYPVDIEYYFQAVNYLESICKNLQFVVFSNDRNSAKSFFGDSKINFSFITGNYTDFEEFCYLSSFDNIIISNSTYSYWAARISKKKNIICPKLFGHKLSPHYMNGALPEDFIII